MTNAAPLGLQADLQPRNVAEFVRRFYQAVAQDDILGPLFNDVAKVDWADHLQTVTAFWSRALFDVSGYDGNPFRAHQLVHAQSPFTAAHFERWLDLFTDTLQEGWTGPNARRALDLAHSVAAVHRRVLLGEAALMQIAST